MTKGRPFIKLAIAFSIIGIASGVTLIAKETRQNPQYRFIGTPQDMQIIMRGLQKLSIEEAGDTYSKFMTQMQQQDQAIMQAAQKAQATPTKDSTATKKKQ